MASNRSSRKIQRVQRAGVTRAAGQRRPMGFTLLLVAIIAVGCGLVFWARATYRGDIGAAPRMTTASTTGDHYRDAFGIYLCDRFIEPLTDAVPDTTGIHTHADGLIQIHPYVENAAGDNAVMQVFFNSVGLNAQPDEVVLPAGTAEKPKTWTSGTTKCTTGKGKKAKKTAGEWVLLRWDPQSGPDSEPDVVTSDYGQQPLRTDGEAWTLAFLPKDEVDSVADRKGKLLPPSVDKLKDPPGEIEQPGGSYPGEPTTAPATPSSAPVTTAPGNSAPSTTVAPSPSTTIG